MKENAVVLFEQNNLVVFQELSDLKKEITRLQNLEKEKKAALEKAMDEYEIVSFKNDLVTISRIEGSETTTIDIDALKEKEPELYADLLKDYPKVKKTKSSIRILAK